MNRDEKLKQLKKLWVAFGFYWDKEINDIQTQLYAEDVSDLPFEDVVRVMQEMRRDPSIKSMPLPGMIRQRISPQPNSRNIAVDTCEKIKSALINHGWSWPLGIITDDGRKYQGCRGKEKKYFDHFEEALRFEVGDLGYEVILRRNGWSAVCEDISDPNSNPESFYAQMRESCQQAYEKLLIGNLHEPYELKKINKSNQISIEFSKQKISGKMNDMISGFIKTIDKE